MKADIFVAISQTKTPKGTESQRGKAFTISPKEETISRTQLKNCIIKSEASVNVLNINFKKSTIYIIIKDL